MTNTTITPGAIVHLPAAWTFEAMDGHVVSVDAEHNLIRVAWDHPAMAQQAPIKYEGEKFLATTHRAGHQIFILDLP